MVLHIPIAVDYFYTYLQSRHEQLKDKQAIHLIALYIDLRLYDKACTDGESEEVKLEIARDVFDQYLSEEAMQTYADFDDAVNKSYFPVKLDQNVKTLFDHKYATLNENLNEYLFIEVYAFVLDKLREYFVSFKSSQAFVKLEDEITQQERLYEVLVEAKLIDIQ